MKLCRFNHDRIGLVEGDQVYEVTDLFDRSPPWPAPPGDWMIRQAVELQAALRTQTEIGRASCRERVCELV